MANQEHLDLFKQGVKVWNQWRKKHPEVEPDLYEANLSSSIFMDYILGKHLSEVDFNRDNLSGADLSRANLIRANLSGVTLSKASFMGADLFEAKLTSTNLIQANFNEANLGYADFSQTSLSGANLSKADLNHANLYGNLSYALFKEADLSFANLSHSMIIGANLSGATIGWTMLGSIDLSEVKGLETVQHKGPSTIGIDTIYRSLGDIPEVFLKGVGVDDTFITYIRSLVRKPIDYYTCFISYSSKDEAFASRLYADLQSHNVRCWFAPEHMKTGDKLRYRIDESIRLYDKLVIVLSQSSVASLWVEHEVETALAKELEGKPNVIYPIRLDEAVMDSKAGWASHIRLTRHITDFTRWKHHDDYQKAFDRLLGDLKAGSD